MLKVIDFETSRRVLRDRVEPSMYLRWIEESLRFKSDFVMPVKTRLSQSDGDYFACMPCLDTVRNWAMVKMIGRHPDPEGSRPSMGGDLMLYEANTGVLRAVMDAEYLTTMRTGAQAAFSVLSFARSGYEVLGLIGLGNIMTACCDVLFGQLKEKNRTYVVRLLKHHGQERRFVERFEKYEFLSFVFCDTFSEVIDGADVVVSALTSATENFADDSCFKEGVTVVPICTMGFQNCDLFFDRVLTDEIEQIRGFKYFDRFKRVENISSFVVEGAASDAREGDDERILVYNYGLASQDLFFAERIYDLVDGCEVPYRSCEHKFFMGR